MENIYLSQKEQKVLECLYQLSDRSVKNLAANTLINRTTLYPILDKLLRKGLVCKSETEEKTIFIPISAADFRLWIKNQENKAKKSSEELEEWIKNTSGKNKKTSLVSSIKYFEGFEGVKNLYADTWRNNSDKEIYCITDFEAAAKSMENFFRKIYLPDRIKHGIKVKNIVTDTPLARKEVRSTKKFLREMKFAKELFKNLGIEINIYDDKLVIVAYDSKKPSGVLIKNEKIAQAMKNIFKYIWKK